jgi:hypothetical protein
MNETLLLFDSTKSLYSKEKLELFSWLRSLRMMESMLTETPRGKRSRQLGFA